MDNPLDSDHFNILTARLESALGGCHQIALLFIMVTARVSTLLYYRRLSSWRSNCN